MQSPSYAHSESVASVPLPEECRSLSNQCTHARATCARWAARGGLGSYAAATILGTGGRGSDVFALRARLSEAKESRAGCETGVAPLPPIDLSACGERACLNLLAPQLQRRPLGDCIMGQGRPSTGRNNREGSETTSSPLPIPWTRKKLLRSLFRFCFLRAGGRKRALRGRNLCLGGTNILARFLGY